MNMRKVRDTNIDILKGIGMLLVIIGHSGCIWPFYPVIYAFHMPLFFLVSGLFFSTKLSVSGGVKLEINRLLINYVEICVITTLFLFLLGEHYEVFLKSAVIGTTIRNDYNIPLGPVWFLLALLWCRIIYRILAEYIGIKGRSIGITAVVIIILMLKLFVFEDLYKCPLNFLQGIVCMFYYHVGVLLRQHDGMEKLKLWNKRKKLSFILISLLLLALSIAVFKRVDSNMNLSMLQTPFLPIDLLNAIGLTLTLFLVICFVSNYYRGLYFFQKGLRWCGEYSMAIFAVHCVEYHTTIRIVSKLMDSLMKTADSFIEKVLLLVANPITQIFICVSLVWLWQQMKVKLQYYNN